MNGNMDGGYINEGKITILLILSESDSSSFSRLILNLKNFLNYFHANILSNFFSDLTSAGMYLTEPIFNLRNNVMYNNNHYYHYHMRGLQRWLTTWKFLLFSSI